MVGAMPPKRNRKTGKPHRPRLAAEAFPLHGAAELLQRGAPERFEKKAVQRGTGGAFLDLFFEVLGQGSETRLQRG